MSAASGLASSSARTSLSFCARADPTPQQNAATMARPASACFAPELRMGKKFSAVMTLPSRWLRFAIHWHRSTLPVRNTIQEFKRPNARESGRSTINPTIATTITMTTTFGSLKLWLATTSAAAMLRWPVPSAMTRFVPGVRSAEHPTDPKAKCDKQQPRKDCSCTEHL